MKRILILLAFSRLLLSQTPGFPTTLDGDSFFKIAKNNLQTKLTVNALATDTSITVVSNAGIVANMLITIDKEILSVCSVTGSTIITVGVSACPNIDGRGFDSTIAALHFAGVNVSTFVDSWHHNSLKNALEQVEITLKAITTPVSPANGGTGVSNGTSTLTLGGNTTFSGAFNPTFVIPSSSSWTFQSGGGTLALTGVDINSSNQVTATHLASALPTNQGGSGTVSALTGLVRGGSPFTAAELSGDATTSGSNVVTVAKLNGTAFTGTNGDVVSFGASNTPADSGFLATNVVRKDAVNTGAAAMSLDLHLSTVANGFRAPVAAGATSTLNGGLIYDSTNNMLHASQNTSDAMIPQFTVTPTNGHCVTWVVSGSNYTQGDVSCPSGGGSGTVNTGTAGHLGYYATSTTAISDMGADFTFSTHTLTGGVSSIFDLSGASVTAGLKIPSAAGATPTVDGFLAVDTTAHRLVFGSNGATVSALGNSTTDTLTNKTYDTAGTGNVFKINGTAVSAITGTGPTAVLSILPTLTGVVLTPTAATGNQAINASQSGPTSGNLGAENIFNVINVTSDQTNTGGAANYNSAFKVVHSFGGSNSSGATNAIYARNLMTAQTSGTNVSRNYVGLTTEFNTTATDGGTNTGAGALGSGFGINAVTNCGGANWYNCSNEFDVGYYGSGTGKYRFGVNVVAANLTQAAGMDAAFVVGSATSTAPWINAIIIGDQNGQKPLDATGCVLCTDGNAHTITTGIDLSSYTISGNSFKMPNGHILTGAGVLQNSGNTIIGSAGTPDSALEVRKTSGGAATPGSANAVLHVSGADSTSPRIRLDAFGNYPIYASYRADNTVASPSAVTVGETLMAFNAYGYGATGYSANGRAQFLMAANENWSDTVQSTFFSVVTTAIGTTTTAERWRFDGFGNFTLINSLGQHINTSGAGSDLSGTCTFASTTCTVTFTKVYNVAPSCTANDQTAAAPIKSAPTTTTVVLTGGTGAGATDVVSYHCFGNPN